MRIASRSSVEGVGISMSWSIRPGRRKAGSRESTLLAVRNKEVLGYLDLKSLSVVKSVGKKESRSLARSISSMRRKSGWRLVSRKSRSAVEQEEKFDESIRRTFWFEVARARQKEVLPTPCLP